VNTDLIPRLIVAAAAIAAIVLFFLPPPAGSAATVMRAAAVVTLTIALVATMVLPEYLVAMTFFFLSVVLAVAPPNVVFSGFHSGAVWMVFGGLFLGVAIETTGLGARIARWLVGVVAGGYFAMLFWLVWLMALLAFFMPSSVGRVTIMMPIVLALADRVGLGEGRPGRAALALALVMGTLTPTFAILPASVPNLALAGAAEAIHGIHFTYADYLVLHFPVIGLVSMIALPPMLWLMFRDRIQAEPAEGEATPVTPSEKRLVVILLAALALWATDSVHGVSPAWIGLGAGILCVLPGIGVMPAGGAIQRMSFGPILFLAGVIGMGAVVTHSGLGRVLGDALLGALALDTGGGFGNFAALIGLNAAMGLVTTLPGEPAIMTAMAENLAKATGWPLLSVLMTQVTSWALMMFPYQAPPLVVAMAVGRITVGQFLRILLPMAVFGWVAMVPLQYWWWRFLGYLP
jgi:anion transporter